MTMKHATTITTITTTTTTKKYPINNKLFAKYVKIYYNHFDQYVMSILTQKYLHKNQITIFNQRFKGSNRLYALPLGKLISRATS